MMVRLLSSVPPCTMRLNTAATWQLVPLLILVTLTSSIIVVVVVAALPSVRENTVSLHHNSVVNLRRSRYTQQQQSTATSENDSATDEVIVFDTVTDSDVASTRLIIEPFQLKLSKYTSTFTEGELFDLRDTMEIIALQDIQNYTLSSTASSSSSTATSMGQIELIKFGAAKQVLNTEYEVVLVKFDFGIAQYNTLPIPHDANIINEWIGIAFRTKLLPNLQSLYPNSAFTLLENISYSLQFPQDPPLIELTNTPNSSPTYDGNDSSVNKNSTDGSNSSTSSKSSSRSNIPLFAGVSVGVVAFTMLVLFVLVAKRRRDTNQNGGKIRELTNASLDFDDTSSFPNNSKKSKKQSLRDGMNSTETSPSSTMGANSRKADMTDARSLADSESEWTVATEAGDTMALKNIVPILNSKKDNDGNTNSSGWSNSKNERQIDLIMSESFERDRTVAITKDMLTGQWSGRVSNHRGGGGTTSHHPQSESVLQPSHFSASQERRVRKAQRAAAAAAAAAASSGIGAVPMPDRENSSVSSRGDEESSVDDLLVFEQAHEDVSTKQKEQVSPSNTNKRRTP